MCVTVCIFVGVSIVWDYVWHPRQMEGTLKVGKLFVKTRSGDGETRMGWDRGGGGGVSGKGKTAGN